MELPIQLNCSDWLWTETGSLVWSFDWWEFLPETAGQTRLL